MEDKRIKELKNKIDEINDLNEKASFYENKLEDTMGVLKFLDAFQCSTISLTGYSDDDGYRECVPMPLRGNDIEEIEVLIEEKLRNQIEEYDDEIIKAYQRLDELLK